MDMLWNTVWRDQRGEVNIVANVQLILVVIALVAIFRSEMTDIVNQMFEKIRSAMDLSMSLSLVPVG